MQITVNNSTHTVFLVLHNLVWICEKKQTNLVSTSARIKAKVIHLKRFHAERAL